MSSPSVTIQITPDSKPAMPSWTGEVAAFARMLTHTGILKTIQEQVRFARARFGHYDLIDFVAVLVGYVLSGESTLLAFYEPLTPWASPFMALFGRDRLPHRSTLSRFLTSIGHPLTGRRCYSSFHESQEETGTPSLKEGVPEPLVAQLYREVYNFIVKAHRVAVE